MKLYTEEQVREAYNKGLSDGKYPIEEDSIINDICGFSSPVDTVIDSLTPIELPNEEQIKEYIDSIPYYGHCTVEFKEGIEDGIKWMKEQILNQTK